jgi:hypothetical protein
VPLDEAVDVDRDAGGRVVQHTSFDAAADPNPENRHSTAENDHRGHGELASEAQR